MQVAITSRHGNIRTETRDHIQTKSEKLLTYFERVTAINVTVDFEGGRTQVEMLVDAEHKHNFVAKDVGEDAAETFDKVLHKMEQQIKKYKGKLQDHRRDRPLNEIAAVKEEDDDDDDDVDEDDME